LVAKKRMLAVACVALLSTGPAFASDWQEIEARGRLRVLAYAYEYPEMFSFEPQSPHGPGLERELLESFCKSNRITLEVLKMEDFTKEIPMLLRDEGDLIIGIINTEQRRELVAFTQEVFPVRFFAGSLVTTPPITTLEQLRERNVGVVAGSSWVGAAQKAGISAERLKVIENQPLMFEALEAGKIGAVVMPVADLALAMGRRPRLREGIPLGESMSGCWAVRKASPELKDRLDAFLAAARSGNVWSRLVVKYYGDRAVQILKKAKD
jgi:polar amino acid transport system substrate-binding protein